MNDDGLALNGLSFCCPSLPISSLCPASVSKYQNSNVILVYLATIYYHNLRYSSIISKCGCSLSISAVNRNNDGLWCARKIEILEIMDNRSV